MSLVLPNFEVHGNKGIIDDKSPVFITFGNFDGVHLGHQFLIESMKKINPTLPIVVVTFEPHSANFFKPNDPKLLLTNNHDKIWNLLRVGATTVIVQTFDKDFASLSADEFCEKWLHSNFNVHSVMLGHDFNYGKKRMGNYSHMQKYNEKYGWEIYQSQAFKHSELTHSPVSSSLIRTEISEGRIENAEKMLGHPYSLSGIVVHGDQRGRTIGFPTANLKMDCKYALPKLGVYACYVQLKDGPLLKGVMNCGVRPSIGKNLHIQIEAHIFDFNKEIYDLKIKFIPKKFIRGEMKFANFQELKEQITKDCLQAKTYFLHN